MAHFEATIQRLVTSGREATHWDFKLCHHDNRAAFLHDILCLANAYHKGERYLIYGVADPAEGCRVDGVQDGTRRTQAELIDFMRSKRFAGDVRPEVELRSISLSGKVLDVLVIFDKPEKPYFLTEQYRDGDKTVRASHIYTRQLDTNTPIDRGADLRSIELMWRERFALDVPPAERMVMLLRHPDQWEKDIGNKQIAYHRVHPEFSISFGEVEEHEDVYSHFYINRRSFLGQAAFRYLSTELFSLPYIYCDEMRITLAAPKNGVVNVKGRDIWYQYYVLEDRNGAFLYFLTDGSLDFHSRISEACFICFRDDAERKAFEEFLSANLSRLDALPEDERAGSAKLSIKRAGTGFVFDPVVMMKVKALHAAWRASLVS